MNDRLMSAMGRGVVLTVLLLQLATAWAADAGRPLVDLDAASLASGPVQAWPNGGSLGGTFAPEGGAAPTQAAVDGRAAVTFGEGRYLASSFKAPSEIVGGRPFTLAVWAFMPDRSRHDVLVSWASRPIDTAEFSYGPGPDGAFFGWDKSVKYAQCPAPGHWHHIAFAYSDGNFRVYVDGALDGERAVKLSPKPGRNILLGAGWNSVDRKPVFPLHGSLARVQIWDRVLTLREVRNAAGWSEAFDPTPANTATVAAETTVLHWQAGSVAAKAYVVRLARDQAAAASDVTAGQRVDVPEYKPTGLVPGQIYFWRVEQIDAEGKPVAKGSTWQFSADGGPAMVPFPRNRVAGVSRETKELTWTPGRYAVAQRLYFGSDRAAVEGPSAAAAKTLEAKAHTLAIPLAQLAYGTTYYWRVEEDNGALPPAKGELWAFRTTDEPVKNDVTFFVGSDTHYGLGNNAELNRKVIDEMNWVPGVAMPEKAGGGIVRTPRGVVLCGDLLDKGFDPKTSPATWAEFVQDYGLTGNDGRLGFPVYEGFGNHDGMTGPSFSRAGIKERNPKRVGLTAISANGFHYSWDWDQVHLVQLNLFPGTDSSDCIVGPPNHHPENSLAFLKEDLAKNVGKSGKVVIVFCHYCYSGGMADWWTEAAKERFRDAVTGYRVLLIHGHSHGAYFYQWKGLRAISDGSTARPESQTGDFLVVHITKDELCIAQRKLDGWGITLKEPLPAAAGPVSQEIKQAP